MKPTHGLMRKPLYGTVIEGVSGVVRPGTFENWYSAANRLGQNVGASERRH